MSATYKLEVVTKNRPDDKVIYQMRSRKLQWDAYLELSNDPRVLSVNRVLDGYKLFTNMEEIKKDFDAWAGPEVDHNAAAFAEGQVYKDRTDLDRDDAFDCYKRAVANGRFEPSVSASVCFVAGYLGNEYPSHDDRVTS